MSKHEVSIEEVIANIEHDVEAPVDDSFSAPGTRQILVIERAVFHTAGYRVSSADPAARSEAYIEVTGRPTPSSQVTKGYIYFVPAAELRVPIYSPETQRIRLWVNEIYMAQMLDQMRQQERYLWVGWFDNGHVYSDVHSA